MDHMKLYKENGWAGRVRTYEMPGSKPGALPLGYSPIKLAGMAGLEPTKCRNQNPVPYQLGDIPILYLRAHSLKHVYHELQVYVKMGWIIGVEPTTSRATI